MDSLLASVESGKASELILESIKKNGRLTDEYIEYILTGTTPTEDASTDAIDASTVEEKDQTKNMNRVAKN